MKHNRKSLVTLFFFAVTLLGCSSYDMEKKREAMIKQLKWQGITNENALKSMKEVPREMFVIPDVRNLAYEDTEAKIDGGDTLNRPFENALILSVLEPKKTDKVLEVGTGSGYQAALFSKLAAEVYTIEIVPDVADNSRKRLAQMGYKNVHVKTGDGFFGWPDKAPFNVMYLSVSPPKVPDPLVEQLADGGLILAPIGGGGKFQEWTLFKKVNGKLKKIHQLSFAQFTEMEGKSKEKEKEEK